MTIQDYAALLRRAAQVLREQAALTQSTNSPYQWLLQDAAALESLGARLPELERDAARWRKDFQVSQAIAKQKEQDEGPEDYSRPSLDGIF